MPKNVEFRGAYRKTKRKIGKSDPTFAKSIKTLEALITTGKDIPVRFNNHYVKAPGTRKGTMMMQSLGTGKWNLWQCHIPSRGQTSQYIMMYATNKDTIVFMICGTHDDTTG